jgi:hypothetical protein
MSKAATSNTWLFSANAKGHLITLRTQVRKMERDCFAHLVSSRPIQEPLILPCPMLEHLAIL